MLVLSHDEVVHGKRSLLDKMPGDLWQRFAGLRAYYGFMLGHPGKKLLFMGSEFGQWREWDASASLDWHLLQYAPHARLQAFVKAANHLYRREPALHQVDFEPRGFEWIDCRDSDDSILSFVRYGEDRRDCLAFVSNFTPVPRYGYRLGVPEGGYWEEVLNSDSEWFGGSNAGNGGGAGSESIGWHGRPHSLLITIPPLATVAFKLRR